jgi:ATP phosphoribosyltransferase regulatory subunit
MRINDAVLRQSERINLTLRELYLSRGYLPYRMSKFEEYDFYARNKSFLVSDNVITFTDTNGKLMALKPDVTLSIIKNTSDAPETVQKVFYSENVYRVSRGTNSFREIMQTGLECIGAVDEAAVCEVLLLAAESLRSLAPEAVLAVSDLDLLQEVIAALSLAPDRQKALFQAIGEKNLHEMEALCAGCDGEPVSLLKSLLSLRGSLGEALPQLEQLTAQIGALPRLLAVLKRLAASPFGEMIHVDFSVTDDINYYNGIVFKGFLRDLPSPVLSGGQYDNLMHRMHRRSRAIGFAVYADALEQLNTLDSEGRAADDFINIALPKGRLGDRVYALFAQAGYECPALLDPGRKLIFENTDKRVRYFWVKPSDVAIYVERGAADVGVAGKDILLEYEPEVYELLDLRTGVCRMTVSAPKTFRDDPSRTLRVATKFSRIAQKFYRSRGRDIDIIHLNGSIEIAPILGLSDVIVDIVETGNTLKENDLDIVETIVPISARFIANKAAYKFKGKQIERMSAALSAILEESK